MLRFQVAAIAAAFTLLGPAPTWAQNGQLQGFAGTTFGEVTTSTTFGGGFAAPVSDHLQIIGEAGRLTDVMPRLVAGILDFTPFDVRVSAWYGEAGVRLIAAPGRAVRPYGEATAGVARLATGFTGVGTRADTLVTGALGLFSRTEPLLGIGAGIVLQGGPVFLDAGYRYKKIHAGQSLQALLAGTDVQVNQVRIGLGVRF